MSNKQTSTPIPLSFPLKLNTPFKTPAPILSKHQSFEQHSHSYSQPPLFNLSIPNISDIANIACMPLPNKRIGGVTISKSIVYGNVTHKLHGEPDYSAILPTPNNNSSFDSNSNSNARRTSRGASSYDTQEWFSWTVYVRGPQNEDLSYFIDKVVFILHETYVNPIRVIENAPFEVTECGWGQFEVKIEIYFHSIPDLFQSIPMSMPPIPTHTHVNNKKRKLLQHDLNHSIGNFNRKKKRKMDELCQNKQIEIMNMFSCVDGLPTDADSDSNSISDSSSFVGYDNKVVFLHSLRLFAKPNSKEDHSKKGIVEEKYATIVFNDPYYYLYKKLYMGPSKLIQSSHPFYEKYWKDRIVNVAQKEQELMQKISKSHEQLLSKINQCKKEYQQLLKANENNKK